MAMCVVGVKQQFVTMLSCLSRGSTSEKLRWIFNLYDVNNCGYLRQEELSVVVTSIYDLLGDSTMPTVSEMDAADKVHDLFEVSCIYLCSPFV
jgi:Ca2+-binding EF-hand superfamily protein